MPYSICPFFFIQTPTHDGLQNVILSQSLMLFRVWCLQCLLFVSLHLSFKRNSELSFPKILGRELKILDTHKRSVPSLQIRGVIKESQISCLNPAVWFQSALHHMPAFGTDWRGVYRQQCGTFCHSSKLVQDKSCPTVALVIMVPRMKFGIPNVAHLML